MKLFHVSEDPNIHEFVPRLPLRDDLDKSIGLVWAIDEKRLPNFLLPRDCPRVCYYVGENTLQADIDKYFSSKTVSHVIAIEHNWIKRIKDTTLYVYEFSSNDFKLQDEIAGYYVATTTQIPIRIHCINDLFFELSKRNIEIRILDHLFDIAESVKHSSLNWSLCRMKNAIKG